jgi:hypothetical protein
MRRALKRILESMHRQLYGEISQPEANRCFRRRAETRPAARDQHNLLASRFVSPILQIPAPPLKQFRMAGYSGKPLAQKLGIKPAMTVTVINQPADYRQLLGEGADGVEFSDRTSTDLSFVHLFTTRRSELEKQFSRLRKKIPDTGTIWISWPKKSGGVPTDVTEDVIRAVALRLGFVDVKVCAIDETWSGLKLMVRRSERKLSSTR